MSSIGQMIVALAAVSVIAGCTSGDDHDSGVTASWQQQLGCTEVAPRKVNQPLVLALYRCMKSDGEVTAVYTFKNRAAKKRWARTAEGAAAIIREGGDWLEVEELMKVAPPNPRSVGFPTPWQLRRIAFA
jgi:hypothetical protein